MENIDGSLIANKFDKALKILDDAMKSLNTFEMHDNFVNAKEYFKAEYDEYSKVKYEHNELIRQFYYPMLQDVYVQSLSKVKINSRDNSKIQQEICSAYWYIKYWMDRLK